jgi:peptidoglycan/LPS O-acetylase OafA/YrhL
MLSAQPTVAPSRRLDFLDALRGLAALAVVMYHFTDDPAARPGGALASPVTAVTQYGHAAVYIFFVLSGFILPWSMDRAKYQWSQCGKFLSRRLLRLWPPCALVLILMAYHKHGFAEWQALWNELWPQLTYTSGILEKPRYLEIFWTLELEMQYYLLIALIFPLLVHRHTWASRVAMAVLCAAPHFSDHRQWLPHYLGFFAMGTAIFLWKSGRCHWCEMACWLLLALLGSQRDYSWLNLGSGLLAVAIILAEPPAGRLLVALGNISYSLYLTHFMALRIAGLVLPQTTDTAAKYLGLVIVYLLWALGFATVFYFISEKPSQKWAARLGRPRGTKGPA